MFPQSQRYLSANSASPLCYTDRTRGFITGNKLLINELGPTASDALEVRPKNIVWDMVPK